jgi:hypothetical protein
MIARNITEQKTDQLASAGAAIDAVVAKRKTAPARSVTPEPVLA